MQTLNLTQGFSPFPDSKEFKHEKSFFSGGEPHIRIEDLLEDGSTPDKDKPVAITIRLVHGNALTMLLVATNALKGMGYTRLYLYVPYFPGGRQDRVCNEGEAFTLEVYADIINAQGYERVYVRHPHSRMTPLLVDNMIHLDNEVFALRVISDINYENLVLVSPDKGAWEDVSYLSHATGMPMVSGGKVRDPKTTKLSGFTVDTKLDGEPCLIVDDICDGGGTFIGLAKELKKNGAGPLYLAVTHGIFSRDHAILVEFFDGVYTSNSFNLDQWKGGNSVIHHKSPKDSEYSICTFKIIRYD